MKSTIDDLLTNACNSKASDLHISAHSTPIIRVNGKLRPYENTLLTPSHIEDMAKQLLGPSWEEFQAAGEIDLAYYIENVSRFRINVFKQKGYISIAARVIPTEIPTIEQLQMPAILSEIALKLQGLVLVTGPTGSGKTTTLAAMINYVNQHKKKHIITLEDPVEYFHTHQQSIVQQREVGYDTKGFSNGLRSALRQDPDIILVGEMRDLETISTAITAAETGHLVLATLHTNSAAQTINRIIDVFPPHQQQQIRIQLASVLEAIVSQRLFKRKDMDGSIAATEILLNHASVANLIRTEKIGQIDNVIQTGKALGMHSLTMSINELMHSGKITYKQAEPYLTTVGGL